MQLISPAYGWAKIKDAARYAGIGDKTFRKWLKKGLRYSKAPTGVLLVKLDDIDAFLMEFEVLETDEVSGIVDSVMSEFV